MDMIKTLLIYLSATMALTVQGADAPKATPVPTMEPPAIVETAGVPADSGTPAETQQITAVPPEQLDRAAASATEAPTPAPVPTITPNRAYRNLAMGARGKEVRTLQEKLIALGYLPEGAADGAYGRQTYNAVKRFQYYNGLKQDGVAGRATQTNMFENPEIVPYPGTETASPAVTDTPAPTPTPTPEPTEAPTEAPTEEPEEAAAEAPGGEDGTLPKWAADLEPEATEEPTPVPATPTPTPIPILTTAPETITAAESTDAPEVTPAPEEELPEIVENVDLDADIYEPIVGIVALNEGSGPLEFVSIEDGVPVTARPRLRQNGAKIQVSLDDLCRCEEGWTLTDDGLGTVVLEAAGYTLAVYNEDKGISASVNGNEIAVRQDDMDFSSDGHFINAEFLASALKGEAEWIPEENTLMLRIRDREAVEAAD